MPTREINSNNHPGERVHAASGLDRIALIAIILGVLTAASILLLIHQQNRALQYRIEAAEVWSDYQVKIVKATTEEDPNLRQQYTEEQDVLRQHAQDLKAKSKDAGDALRFSAYAAVLLLIAASIAVFAILAKSIYASYLGLLLGIIGVGLNLRALL
jgi:hypothetical protein